MSDRPDTIRDSGSAVHPDVWLPYMMPYNNSKSLLSTSAPTLDDPLPQEKTGPNGSPPRDVQTPAAKPTGSKPVPDFLQGQGRSGLIPSKAGRGLKRDAVLEGDMKEGALSLLQLTHKFDAEMPNKVRREINQFGSDPTNVLINAVRNSDVVAVGETHIPGSPHRMYVRAHLAELVSAGATHFAIELKEEYQQDVDDILAGRRTKGATRFYEKNPEFVDFFKEAKNLGLQIVYVDAPQKVQDEARKTNKNPALAELAARDKYMASAVERILTSPGKNKVLLWCGALHSSDPPGATEYPSTVEILRDRKFRVTSISEQTEAHAKMFEQAALITSDLKNPVAVSTKRATQLGELSVEPTLLGRVPGSHSYKNWDYIFFYPHLSEKR